MKVLLTGAFGNIGSHTVPELLRQGHQVRCLDLGTPDTRRVAQRHQGSVEVVFGDIREPSVVAQAVSDVDAVLHLAALIPPGSDEDPKRAREINVEGTQNVVAACRAQDKKPKLLFTSSLDVFGRTQARPPPRKVDEPVQATDPYTEHKIEGEKLVRESGLQWCIFRLSDVPIIGLRDPVPIMFEIGLHNRIEAMHPDDAALALSSALTTPEAWNRVLLVGGGPSCQVTYREYLLKLMTAMGMGALPDEAFTKGDYCTDWLDSSEAQRLFGHQRHTFDQIVAEIAACLGWKKVFVPLARPFVRRSLLKMSPYYAKRALA